jgi:DNA-binding MarR family transcriptional regulator
MTSTRSDDGDHVDGIVAAWARERPDLDTSSLATFGRIFRVAALADAALARGIEPHALQPRWFDILAALRRAGVPFELNPTELMRSTLLSSGGMTKRLDRLAEAGLVRRRPDPSDRRGTLVGLTRKGRATVDTALVTHLANEDRLLAPLGATDRRSLDRLLRKLLIGLESAAGTTNDP